MSYKDYQRIDIKRGQAKNRPDMTWWESPYYEEMERQQQAREEGLMKRQLRNAENERNAAMIGDIARLGAQMWASKGGAWDIRQTQPYSAARNEQLQAIRDKNAANQLNFAQRLRQARMADMEDARKKKMFELELQAKNYNMQAKARMADMELAKILYNNKREERKMAETAKHNREMEAIARRRIDKQGAGSSKEKIRIRGGQNGEYVEFPRDRMGVAQAYNYIIGRNPSLRKNGEPILDVGGNVKGYKPITEADMIEVIEAYNSDNGAKQEMLRPLYHSSVFGMMGHPMGKKPNPMQ